MATERLKWVVWVEGRAVLRTSKISAVRKRLAELSNAAGRVEVTADELELAAYALEYLERHVEGEPARRDVCEALDVCVEVHCGRKRAVRDWCRACYEKQPRIRAAKGTTVQVTVTVLRGQEEAIHAAAKAMRERG